MDKKYKEKWVAALRSGEHKQGIGRLKSSDGYCCLGVLCEVVGLPFDGLACYPPLKVMNIVGLGSDDPTVMYKGERRFLTFLNDSEELTFNQIADLIEQQL